MKNQDAPDKGIARILKFPEQNISTNQDICLTGKIHNLTLEKEKREQRPRTIVSLITIERLMQFCMEETTIEKAAIREMLEMITRIEELVLAFKRKLVEALM